MRSITALWHDKPIRWAFVAGVLLLAATIGVVLWTDASATPRPLHYNIYFGIDLFGAGTSLWWNPATSGVILTCNMVVAGIVLERQLLAARLLAWSATVTAAIVLAATSLAVTYQPLQ